MNSALTLSTLTFCLLCGLNSTTSPFTLLFSQKASLLLLPYGKSNWCLPASTHQFPLSPLNAKEAFTSRLQANDVFCYSKVHLARGEIIIQLRVPMGILIAVRHPCVLRSITSLFLPMPTDDNPL